MPILAAFCIPGGGPPAGVGVALRQESEQGCAAARAALLQPRWASCRRPNAREGRLLPCVQRNRTPNPTGSAGSEARSCVTRPHSFRPVGEGTPPFFLSQQQICVKHHFIFFDRTYQYFKSGLLFQHLSLSLELSNDEMHTAPRLCHRLPLACEACCDKARHTGWLNSGHYGLGPGS